VWTKRSGLPIASKGNNAPLDLRGQLSTTESLGIAVGAEEQPEGFVRATDLTMYRGKSGGKAHGVVFDHSR
jgi:GGDEF domain-containing protein